MTGSRNQKGFVLVFALWVLGVLTILAVSVAAGIRQKIFLVGRLDERSRMNDLLESAVKKAAGYIHEQMATSSFALNPTVKMGLFNNTSELSSIRLGADVAGVGYVFGHGSNASVRWGVVDEESKINLNTTNVNVLTALLMNVLGLNEEAAQKQAEALLDWRQMGESELTGFYSEDYYSNLQYPYPKKNAGYESLDEILLVKGINLQVFHKLLDYVTVYGDGAVNINTSSPEVLEALGLPEPLVEKILTARRGNDGIEATLDDRVFSKTYEISADLNSVVALTLPEAHAIDALNMQGLLSTASYFYTIQATGRLGSRSTTRSVRAVYSSRDDKIVDWRER